MIKLRRLFLYFNKNGFLNCAVRYVHCMCIDYNNDFKCITNPNWNVKGQLISKCPFGVKTSSKNPTKFFPGFLPQPLKRGQIKKIRALYYTNQGLFNIIGIIKFLIQPTFRGYCRNPGKNFVDFFVQTMTPKRHFEIN